MNDDLIFLPVADKLIPGERYTLVSFEEWGFPFHMHFTLEETRPLPYAQYEDAISLIYTQRGRRKPREMIFYGIKTLILYKGWFDVDTEIYRTEEQVSNGVTIRKGLRSFSSEYLDIARASVPAEPVVDIRWIGRQRA